MESIGIEAARADLGGVVDRARLKQEPTLITRAGKPAAVVVSVDHMLGVWGLAATTIGGGHYAKLRRELRELANGTEET